MRKLLPFLIALALSLGAAASSNAQVGGLSFPGPGTPHTTTPAYTGPGDVVASNWIFWFGLRAFSGATAGTKAANICNSGDANCADVNTLANGNFDVATATGAPLNCGGVGGTCTIKTLYDKSGNTNCTTACDFTQATIASRPTLVFNCINTSLPCIDYSGSNVNIQSAANTVLFTQPYTASFVFKNTSGSITDFIANGGAATFMHHSAGTNSLFSGAFGDYAATDNVFHAVNATYNNGTPANTVSVDGTLSSPTPGTNNINSGSAWNFGYNGNAGIAGQTGELGFNSASFVGTPATNLCHNQRLYWGTGGSC